MCSARGPNSEWWSDIVLVILTAGMTVGNKLNLILDKFKNYRKTVGMAQV